MDKTTVTMRHPEAAAHIEVLPAEVENARKAGWVVAAPAAIPDPDGDPPPAIERTRTRRIATKPAP